MKRHWVSPPSLPPAWGCWASKLTCTHWWVDDGWQQWLKMDNAWAHPRCAHTFLGEDCYNCTANSMTDGKAPEFLCLRLGKKQYWLVSTHTDSRMKPTSSDLLMSFPSSSRVGFIEKQTNKQTERLRLEGDLKAHLVPAHKQGCHPLDKLKRTVSSLGKTKAAQYMLSLHGGFSSVNRHGFLSYQLLKCISRWALQTHCRQTQTFCF